MLSHVRLRTWLCRGFGLCALVALLLYLTLPNDASPEYEYTVRLLFPWVFPLALLIAFVSSHTVSRLFSTFRGRLSPRRYAAWKFTSLFALLFLLVPLLSPPAGLLSWRLGYALSAGWALGTLCASICIFLTAAACKNNALSSFLSLAASLVLAFSCMEGYLLLTSQPEDALVDDSRHSKYVLSGQAATVGDNSHMTPMGDFVTAMGHPVATAQRMLKFDRQLFDVRYSFDAQGRRVTPADTGRPTAEILLFGCSYTFGHGLEDEQTYAWRLGKLLGPDCRISNYAYNGFGAQQMLTLSEEKAIARSKAPVKAALFLAIEHHLRRNAGLLDRCSVRYALRDDGRLARDGFTTDAPYRILFLLPKIFNGSQLARHMSLLAVEAIAKRDHDALAKTYLAIIEKSARLLRKEYDAPLTVLLWPDVAYLEPELRRRGIAVIQAHALLPDWDATRGDAYCIDPRWERHPNAKAADELAKGLAAYFRPLLGLKAAQ